MTLSLQRKARGKPQLLDSLPLLYRSAIPLKRNTHADVMDLVEKNIIPVAYHPYYKSLTVAEEIESLSEDDKS